MNTVIDSFVTMPSWIVYLIVGALVIGESAAFLGLVLPGETALLAAGAVAAVGQPSLAGVIVTGVVGAIVGDLLGYTLGRVLGPGIRASRAGRWVGEERWLSAQQTMARRGGLAVMGGRWVGVLRALVPAVAGMSGMPLRHYMIYNVIGGTLWVCGVATFGFLAGSALGASALAIVSMTLLGLTVVSIAIPQIVKRFRRRSRCGLRPATPDNGVARAKADSNLLVDKS